MILFYILNCVINCAMLLSLFFSVLSVLPLISCLISLTSYSNLMLYFILFSSLSYCALIFDLLLCHNFPVFCGWEKYVVFISFVFLFCCCVVLQAKSGLTFLFWCLVTFLF